MIEPEINKSITITDNAKAAVLEAVKDFSGEWFLRIFVQNSPTGLQYAMAVDTKAFSQDKVIETNGLKVVVDNISEPFVLGATVDFVKTEENAGFKVSNPYVDLSAIGGSCCSGGSCGGGSCGSGGCGSC